MTTYVYRYSLQTDKQLNFHFILKPSKQNPFELQRNNSLNLLIMRPATGMYFATGHQVMGLKLSFITSRVVNPTIRAYWRHLKVQTRNNICGPSLKVPPRKLGIHAGSRLFTVSVLKTHLQQLTQKINPCILRRLPEYSLIA